MIWVWAGVIAAGLIAEIVALKRGGTFSYYAKKLLRLHPFVWGLGVGLYLWLGWHLLGATLP